MMHYGCPNVKYATREDYSSLYTTMQCARVDTIASRGRSFFFFLFCLQNCNLLLHAYYSRNIGTVPMVPDIQN